MRTFKPILFSTVLVLVCILGHAQLQYGWEQKSSLPASGRHRASSIAIGNRGYLGLGHYNSTGEVVFNDWWEYDPGSDTWTQKSSLPAAGRFGAVAFSIGNFGYIIQGNNGSSNLNDSWKYDPVTNSWSTIAAFPGGASGKAVGAVANGKAYVGNAEATNTWYEYNPVTNSWLACATFPGPQRNFSAVFSLNNKIYLGTGITFTYTAMYNDFWCFDPAVNSWTAKANFPGGTRYCTQGFSLLGKGYIGLGYSTATTNNFSDVYAYDEVSNSWSSATSFPGTARRLTTAFTLNNRVYLATGTSGANLNDLWEFGSLTDIAEESSTRIRVYPNPVTEFFVLEFPTPMGDGAVTIYDLSGKIVHEESLSGNQLRIECGEWNAGVYTVQIRSSNGEISHTRIVRN